MNPTQYGKKTATFGQSSHHCPTGFFSGLSLLAIADEVIDLIFRNASIEGGEVTLWVNLDIFATFARCRLVLQLRKYRCIATNGRNGQKAVIAGLRGWRLCLGARKAHNVHQGPRWAGSSMLRAHARNVEAEAALRAATRVDPTFAEAWYNLGDLLDEEGRCEAGIECLRKALQVAPDYADAMFNLALLLQRKNQHAEAAIYWRRYLASDRQSEWAARARRSLKFCEMQVHLNVSPTGTGLSPSGAAARR